MGRDAVPVADLKMINRSLKELRAASKVFAPYQGVRKVAVFGVLSGQCTREHVHLALRLPECDSVSQSSHHVQPETASALPKTVVHL